MRILVRAYIDDFFLSTKGKFIKLLTEFFFMRIHENPNIIVLQDVGSKFNSSKLS